MHRAQLLAVHFHFHGSNIHRSLTKISSFSPVFPVPPPPVSLQSSSTDPLMFLKQASHVPISGPLGLLFSVWNALLPESGLLLDVFSSLLQCPLSENSTHALPSLSSLPYFCSLPFSPPDTVYTHRLPPPLECELHQAGALPPLLTAVSPGPRMKCLLDIC